MKAEEFLNVLKRIAGQELAEGETYDEQFIVATINSAYNEYDAVVKDRDRIKARYIEDFTKPKEAAEEKEEKEEKEDPVELSDFLNI